MNFSQKIKFWPKIEFLPKFSPKIHPNFFLAKIRFLTKIRFSKKSKFKILKFFNKSWKSQKKSFSFWDNPELCVCRYIFFNFLQLTSKKCKFRWTLLTFETVIKIWFEKWTRQVFSGAFKIWIGKFCPFEWFMPWYTLT